MTPNMVLLSCTYTCVAIWGMNSSAIGKKCCHGFKNLIETLSRSRLIFGHRVKLPINVDKASTIIYKVTSFGPLINIKIAIIDKIFTNEFFKTVTLKSSIPS